MDWSNLHPATGADVQGAAEQISGNIELIRLTEQVIFSEPYFDASNNWHTSPHLDDLAKLFQTDANIKAAISRLKVCAMGRDVISIPPPPLMPLPSLLISPRF